jgi:peptide/nickel transport system ATP-binding protein
VAAPEPKKPLLSVQGLTTSFQIDGAWLRAVDDVSFDIGAAESVGIVGESGCGKSVTALSILRLLPTPPARIDSGAIELEGKNLLALRDKEMRKVRGNEISMIFQEPMTSLNPVYTVGSQIVEAIRLHQKKSRSEARERAEEMLRRVGIPSPETNIDAYPHELSGGMRQRVMIAMALACEPKVLIADEPTTALDVTIQAQILELMAELQKQLGMSLLLITHDLGVVAEYTKRVVVMYAGRVVEEAPATVMFKRPRHPYTRGLMESLPSLAPMAPRPSEGKADRRPRLPTIAGMVPDLRERSEGCSFADRCPLVIDACREKTPELLPVNDQPETKARCIRSAET